MAVRQSTRTRWLCLATFAVSGSLILLGYAGVDSDTPPESSAVDPGRWSVFPRCISRNDSIRGSHLGHTLKPSPGVAIITWSLNAYVRELLGSLTSFDHVTVLCLGGGHLCRRPTSGAVAVLTSDCDQRHLESVLLRLRVGAVHFAYDADEHVTIARTTSSVIGRLLRCHTAVMESLVRRASVRNTVYFHFVRPPAVYYGSEEYTATAVRPCAVTYDLRDGHQLYVKILETIVTTYHSLYNFSCYHVV